LGDFAEYVFNYGFKSARGDSGVAINCAVSAIASCFSIVELNLISLPVTPRTEAIRQRKAKIKSHYEKLSKKINSSLSVLENESLQNRNFQKSIADFRRGNLEDSISSNSDIENIVRKLQNTIWLQRETIYKNKNIKTPLDILQPDIVLEKVMGYTFQRPNSLGIYELNGEIFETAGLINKNEQLVQVSKRFPQETQNFTAAHELGHAILHKQTVLHRDKPLDGSTIVLRSREEMQADKFATFFLMPSKLVEDAFFEIFETVKFTINEASVLAIRAGNIDILKRRSQNKRGLARILSVSEYYGGKTFNSLTKIFKVSTETMAIRLEELDLLEF
jgi:Zn-dependent peptidase ImmA (M78 family)